MAAWRPCPSTVASWGVVWSLQFLVPKVLVFQLQFLRGGRKIQWFWLFGNFSQQDGSKRSSSRSLKIWSTNHHFLPSHRGYLIVALTGMLVQRHAEGQQAGAHSHGAALPPLFPFGLTPDEHFQQALHRAQLPLPFEHSPVLDQDLQFAAYLHAKVRGHLRRWRQQAVGALRELKQRWQGVTTMLHSRQEPAIQQVTQERDLGLTALLILLTSWADTGYPFGLVRSGLRCFPESASLPSHSWWCAIRLASPQQKHPLPTSPGTGWWVPIETIHSRCRERFLHVSHVKGWTAADYSRSSSSSHPKMCNYPELGETKSHR